jgi:hypothetical protein
LDTSGYWINKNVEEIHQVDLRETWICEEKYGDVLGEINCDS